VESKIGETNGKKITAKSQIKSLESKSRIFAEATSQWLLVNPTKLKAMQQQYSNSKL